MEWWAQVIEKPEERRIMVFSKGIKNGLKLWIIWGGHIKPISILGDRLEWKKAQKNLKKKKISLTMNKIILNL